MPNTKIEARNVDYIQASETPNIATGAIKLHSAEDFAGMRKAGNLAARTLDYVAEHIAVGMTTEDVDKLVHDYIMDNGGIPATLGYRGYTHSSCTSVNHVVCHGIPGNKKLKDGDILNIDVTPIVDGWHGDTSRMFFVGEKVPVRAKRLCEITYDAMMHGIEVIKPGATTGDIGHAIQTYAESHRCSIVTDFCGHGLGRIFHDAPNILNYGKRGGGAQLREGMFFTVEPMVNLGRPETKILDNGWTAVTRDRQLSAQFEHSVGVTANGVEIFTESPKGYHQPPYNV